MNAEQTYISEWTKPRPANGVYSDIITDVWGRPKSIQDYSVFRGLFTYDIPAQLWLYKKIEEIPGIVKESEEKVIESIGIVNNGISYIIENTDLETLSDKIDKLEVKTDESIKLSNEQAREGKHKVEKLSHTIETYRLEDEIKEEKKELEQLHEVKIETEVKELETEIQIQDEVKTLALEAQIQEEIKLLSNI